MAQFLQRKKENIHLMVGGCLTHHCLAKSRSQNRQHTKHHPPPATFHLFIVLHQSRTHTPSIPTPARLEFPAKDPRILLVHSRCLGQVRRARWARWASQTSDQLGQAGLGGLGGFGMALHGHAWPPAVPGRKTSPEGGASALTVPSRYGASPATKLLLLIEADTN